MLWSVESNLLAYTWALDESDNGISVEKILDKSVIQCRLCTSSQTMIAESFEKKMQDIYQDFLPLLFHSGDSDNAAGSALKNRRLSISGTPVNHSSSPRLSIQINGSLDLKLSKFNLNR